MGNRPRSEARLPISCVILTTDTKHHRYFANRMARLVETTVVFEKETRSHSGDPAFERLQDRFEDRFFSNGVPSPLRGHSMRYEFNEVNDPGCLKVVGGLRPLLLVTFGTRKVIPELYRLARVGINLHRGMLPQYRGLDSDLWACYLRDFESLGVTVHRLDERLDTGEILYQKRLPIEPGMKAHQIRYHTTLLAMEGVEDFVSKLIQGRPPAGIPQDLSKGRYYSTIPPLKRRLAIQRFHRYVESLGE